MRGPLRSDKVGDGTLVEPADDPLVVAVPAEHLLVTRVPRAVDRKPSVAGLRIEVAMRRRIASVRRSDHLPAVVLVAAYSGWPGPYRRGVRAGFPADQWYPAEGARASAGPCAMAIHHFCRNIFCIRA
jgi:hypothetical protein